MRGSALIAAAAVAAAVSVHAGQGGSGQRSPVFTTRTQGVLVDVLVTERNRPVAGLKADDFELRDNGVLQTIDSAEISDAPLNAVLALDVSGSTEGRRITDLKAASAAFVDGLRPRDRIALTTFTHAVAPRVPLTEEFGSIGAALNALKPGGETAILDGVHVALMATQAEPGRSLVVVFTDGRDTMSWLQDDEVVESAKRSNAVIYPVATGRARSWPVLQDLADTTGGRAIEIETGADLHKQFERILLEFRSRYVLTYVPRGVSETGFHRLSVRARRGGVSVKARPGYVASGVERP
jgi:Ca-activated chloride channel family protein